MDKVTGGSRIVAVALLVVLGSRLLDENRERYKKADGFLERLINLLQPQKQSSAVAAD
ncbi:hypothetical protein MHBO_000677 [Bonamia ostreae]|uniref:Uncharacterized protein n=1 Tax=Bonamia ostreae TaxID=126728 RepID=A0ABV2AGJ4_9EUKA